MNKKLEEAIAEFRCTNKPVKLISKTLGVKKDDIEKIIKHWIIHTNLYIEDLIKNRKTKNNPSIDDMLKLVKTDSKELVKNGQILDYIARNRNNHHDRFMDCIRYKIYNMLENKK